MQGVHQIASHYSIFSHLALALICPNSPLTTLMHDSHKTSASGHFQSLLICLLLGQFYGHGVKKHSSNMSGRIQGIFVTKVVWRVIMVKMQHHIRLHKLLIHRQLVPSNTADDVETKVIWMCLMCSWPCGHEQRERVKESCLAVMPITKIRFRRGYDQ